MLNLEEYITIFINKHYHTNKKNLEVKYTKDNIINILYLKDPETLQKICRLNGVKTETFSDYFKLKRVKMSRIEGAFLGVNFTKIK